MRRGINQSQLEEEQKPSEKINYTEKHFTRQRIQRIRIKDANKLGRWIDEYSKSFNKELGKNQPELKNINIITKMKNTLEGNNSRLNNTVEHTSDVEDSINGDHPIRRAKITCFF